VVGCTATRALLLTVVFLNEVDWEGADAVLVSVRVDVCARAVLVSVLVVAVVLVSVALSRDVVVVLVSGALVVASLSLA
jgi:hypothetical protein